MTTAIPAIYFGDVLHTRHKPRVHRLRYRVFSALLDVDNPAGPLKYLSHNRFNLFAFHDRDHGAGLDQPLRPWIETQLQKADIDLKGGKILILCYPRILGYVFNPLSVYFCYHRAGHLAAIIYEVSNTFDERHSYVLPVEREAGVIRQQCAKQFFVSPFNDISGTYNFDIVPPDETVSIVINQMDREGEPLLRASFTGVRENLTDRTLIQAFIRHPLMTVKVIVGIHWEAWKLWRKGLKIRQRPDAPSHGITIGTLLQRPE